MNERYRHDRLVDDEGDDEQGTAGEQTADGAGIEPIEAVALVEPRIDEGEAETDEDDAAPIRAAEQDAVDRPTRPAQPDEQEHGRRQRPVLPENPLPATPLRGPGLRR